MEKGLQGESVRGKQRREREQHRKRSKRTNEWQQNDARNEGKENKMGAGRTFEVRKHWPGF